MVTCYNMWGSKNNSLIFPKLSQVSTTVTKYIPIFNKYRDSVIQEVNIRGTEASNAILEEQKKEFINSNLD